MKYISIELLHGEYFHCRLQESFQTAKLAYRQFKLRVRKTLSSSHMGPETLEDATVDYIVRNLDLYDVQASVNVRLITHLLIINCASFPSCLVDSFIAGSTRQKVSFILDKEQDKNKTKKLLLNNLLQNNNKEEKLSMLKTSMKARPWLAWFHEAWRAQG